MEWHDFLPNGTGVMTAKPQPEPLFLSFDDGPDPRYTESLLDLLAARHIRASFFVVARFAEQNPQTILRMKEDGHLIGLHSAEHISAYLMTPSYAAWDFRKSLEVLQKLGVRPAFYRPPWGHATWLTRQLAADHHLQIVRWDVMVGDWKAFQSAEETAAKLYIEAAPGKIICLHDGRGRRGAPSRTLEALRALLPLWQSEGYTFDTIDKLYAPPQSFKRQPPDVQDVPGMPGVPIKGPLSCKRGA